MNDLGLVQPDVRIDENCLTAATVGYFANGRVATSHWESLGVPNRKVLHTADAIHSVGCGAHNGSCRGIS